MVPNDFCRICKVNMRETGVFYHSTSIFEKRSKAQAIVERFKNIGLTVTQEVGQSERICQRCASTLTRLERDLPVFRKWESEYGGATSEAITLKREHEPAPAETPGAPKKRRPGGNGVPSRKSITEIVTSYPSKTVTTVCDPEDAPIVNLLQRKKWKGAAKKIIKHKELFQEIKNGVLEFIDDECVRVCSPKEDFLLFKSSPEDLKSFSFLKLESDLQRLAPFLLSIIHCVTNKSHLTTCAAAAIALRGRQPRLSAFAYYLNSILQYGGAKKSVFNRLSKMSLTTTHQAAIVKRRELAATCGAGVRHLKRKTELVLNVETVKVKEEEEEYGGPREQVCDIIMSHGLPRRDFPSPSTWTAPLCFPQQEVPSFSTGHHSGSLNLPEQGHT